MIGRYRRLSTTLGGLIAVLLLCGAAEPEKTLEGARGAVQQQTPQGHARDPKATSDAGITRAAPPAPKQQSEAQPKLPSATGAQKTDSEQGFAADPLRWLMAWILDADNFSNFLIMLFTGLLTMVAFMQHRLEERLAEDNVLALRIASESAEAAKESNRLSADSLYATTRPWVFVVSLKPTDRLRVVRRDGAINAIRFPMELILRNVGNSPAIDVEIDIGIVDLSVRRLAHDQSHMGNWGEVKGSSEMAIFPGEEKKIPIDWPLPAEEFQHRLTNDHGVIWLEPFVFGCISYRGGGRDHARRTRFAYGVRDLEGTSAVRLMPDDNTISEYYLRFVDYRTGWGAD
jgi:hypothetical protein